MSHNGYDGPPHQRNSPFNTQVPHSRVVDHPVSRHSSEEEEGEDRHATQGFRGLDPTAQERLLTADHTQPMVAGNSLMPGFRAVQREGTEAEGERRRVQQFVNTMELPAPIPEENYAYSDNEDGEEGGGRTSGPLGSRQTTGLPPLRSALRKGKASTGNDSFDPSTRTNSFMTGGTENGPNSFKVTVRVTKDNKTVEEHLDPHELAKLYASRQAASDSLQQNLDYLTVPEWVQLHPTMGCYLAELTGTFAWVLTFTLTSVRNESIFSMDDTTDMTCVTIGFMFTAMVFMLGYVSGGHFNPAISLAVFITRNMDLLTMLGYVMCQLGAAVLAGFVAMFLQNSDTKIFVPFVDSNYISKGIFSELIFTFAIVMVVLNIGYSRQHGNFFYGFALGMCVTAGNACAGRISGGCFNPAASTGLQLAQCFAGDCDALKTFWVYWIAPVVGAVAASLIFSQMAQPETTQLLQDHLVFKDSSNNTFGDNTALSVRERNLKRLERMQKRAAEEESEGSHFDESRYHDRDYRDLDVNSRDDRRRDNYGGGGSGYSNSRECDPVYSSDEDDDMNNNNNNSYSDREMDKRENSANMNDEVDVNGSNVDDPNGRGRNINYKITNESIDPNAKKDWF